MSVLLVASLYAALACTPAASPGEAVCEALPRSARGCLDGNVIRPVGCTLRNGPAGPDSPGANCTCIERDITGVIEWDCKKWL
jgi:hypothetical protein